MAATQFDKFWEVIDTLDNVKVLQDIVLIGSWCELIYEEYFKEYGFKHGINTRDVDFLVDIPPKISKSIDIVKELADKDFIVQRLGRKGFIRLATPELMVEFLVPERGKGSSNPYVIKELGINAQPLRMLSMLLNNSIVIKWNDYKIRVPHPSRYALHKLMISSRRTKEVKTLKDTLSGLRILQYLTAANQGNSITKTLGDIPIKWKKKIIKRLEEIEPNINWKKSMIDIGNNDVQIKLVGNQIILESK